MPNSGPGSVFGVRSTCILAPLRQIPARSASGAASIAETLPIPARRSAKAKAQPVWPPPTMTTLWSVPSRSGTQFAGSGPWRRSASRAARSGSVMVLHRLSRESGNPGRAMCR